MTLSFMEKNQLIKPFVKWAGGKRQLFEEIKKHIPKNFTTYFEPFVGGGAVLFGLQPQQFVINDINAEIINVYKTIKKSPDELISELKNFKNEENMYYKIREQDRDPKFKSLSTERCGTKGDGTSIF